MAVGAGVVLRSTDDGTGPQAAPQREGRDPRGDGEPERPLLGAAAPDGRTGDPPDLAAALRRISRAQWLLRLAQRAPTSHSQLLAQAGILLHDALRVLGDQPRLPHPGRGVAGELAADINRIVELHGRPMSAHNVARILRIPTRVFDDLHPELALELTRSGQVIRARTRTQRVEDEP